MRRSIARHKVISVIVIICMAAVISLLFYYCRSYMIAPVSEETLDSIRRGSTKKLMIVAHPDDETLWGGLHLLNDDYYIVCITNGRNSTRAAEFESMLQATGSRGIIMSYPDKVFWRRDDWSAVYEDITADVRSIIASKDWEMIVTHNPDGEYGHEHHIMTDRIVTEVCKEQKMTSVLHYFGRYYSKAALKKAENNITGCSREELGRKDDVLALYKSQESTVKKLSHMKPYEEWTAYEEWK